MKSPAARRITTILASRGLSTLLVASATIGCGPADELIVAPEDWQVVTPDQDPWPAGNDQAPCPDRAGQFEEGFFEIDLKECGWVTARAPSRAAIASGQVLTAVVFHTALVSDEPATATIGLMVDRTEVWRIELPIPAPTGFHEVQVPLSTSVASGADLHWHVHNHGANSYRIGPVRSVAAP